MLVLGALLATAGCAPHHKPVDFVCGDGTVITASFTPDTVRVTVGQEHLVLPQVPSGSGARYNDGTWQLWNKGAAVMLSRNDSLLQQDCETRGSMNNPAHLAGAAWLLEDLTGRGVIDNTHVTLSFLPDNRVSGSGGCNRFTGSVVITGDHIHFSPLASTMMACPPALMDQEARYFAALGKAVRLGRDSTGALLIHVEGEVRPLLFRRET
jgi:heat shock protein HslJ